MQAAGRCIHGRVFRVWCLTVAISLAPHHASTAAALLRLLASWLAVIVFAQGLAAAQALGSGPLHRHRESVAFGQFGQFVQHHHHHAGAAEHHHHAALDSSVVVASEEGNLDTAAFAITAALALMVLAFSRAAPAACRETWLAAGALAWRSTTPAALRKPPRLA